VIAISLSTISSFYMNGENRGIRFGGIFVF
jgi:hypothetical protein